MTLNISIEHGYANNNEPNNYILRIGTLRLWFSYKTVIAFDDCGNFKCRVNEWKQTTGKHLNAICPDKKERIDGEEFERQLKDVLLKRGFEV